MHEIDIETIRTKVKAGDYIISFTHTEKVRIRKIEAEEIEHAICNGAIIEPYPDDPRGASCLVLGFTSLDRPLHIICGRLEEDEILIITAYEPDPKEWEADRKNEKDMRLGMLDKCYFCKSRVVEQHITIDYRWGDTLVVIKNVPAGVCQQCGEKYLASDVYKNLENLAKSKSHLMGKMTVDILAFESIAAA